MKLIAALASAAMLALAACNNGTPPPKTEAEKGAIALELATLMMIDADIADQASAEVINSGPSRLSTECDMNPSQFPSNCRELAAQAQEIMTSVLTDFLAKVRALRPEFQKDWADLFMAAYTAEEMVALKDLYGSPEGKSILKKQAEARAAGVIERSKKSSGGILDQPATGEEKLKAAFDSGDDAARRQAVDGEMNRRLKAQMREADGFPPAAYTDEELAKLNAFYGTPEGRVIQEKYAFVRSAYQTKVSIRTRPLLMEMVAEGARRTNALFLKPPSPSNP